MTGREQELRARYPGYFLAKLDAEIAPGALPREFHVITACDPMGAEQPPEVNAERTADFALWLEESDWEHFPVTGYDPTPGALHREPGFGVVCTEGQALETARRLGQIAIFSVSGGGVELVFCAEPVERFAVGSWEEMTS